MTRPVVSRRTFLGTIGAAGMGSLLPTLEAEAQTIGIKKRLIMLTSGNGTVPADWKPTATAGALTSLNKCMVALEPFKQDLIVVDGLGWQFGDGPGVDHMRIAIMWNGSPMLVGNDFSNDSGTRPCGWGSSISIDQQIANSLVETAKTPFKSLEFGVNLNRHHIYTRVNYAGSNQPIAPEPDPYAMFDRLFKNIGAQPSTPADLDRIRPWPATSRASQACCGRAPRTKSASPGSARLPVITPSRTIPASPVAPSESRRTTGSPARWPTCWRS
jgi:hypothetical protein